MKKAIKNKFGQYFTPDIVAEFMIDLSTVGHNAEVLEPCCGKGVFLRHLTDKGFKNITGSFNSQKQEHCKSGNGTQKG